MNDRIKELKCPKCDYILPAPEWRCPNCYYEFEDFEESSEIETRKSEPSTITINPLINISRTRLNVTFFIGIFVFAIVIIFIFQELNRKRLGWFYFISVAFLGTSGIKNNYIFGIIGFIIYIIAWVHANIILSKNVNISKGTFMS